MKKIRIHQILLVLLFFLCLGTNATATAGKNDNNQTSSTKFKKPSDVMNWLIGNTFSTDKGTLLDFDDKYIYIDNKKVGSFLGSDDYIQIEKKDVSIEYEDPYYGAGDMCLAFLHIDPKNKKVSMPYRPEGQNEFKLVYPISTGSDKERASWTFSDYKKAALDGDAEGQFIMGLKSFANNDNKVNDDVLSWFTKAANQGYLYAKLTLANYLSYLRTSLTLSQSLRTPVLRAGWPPRGPRR